MKYRNRLKRVADILEKLGVAGIALGIFQGTMTGFWAAVVFLAVSIFITKEE